ncbi:MAG: penicillin-binding protein activator [Gammaproteobacteria bacterium]|nr:MAG: penicillin-binding protein activator [Gammaproteobacteria bacterium]
MQPAAPEPDTRIQEQARLLQDVGDYQGAAAIYLDAAGPAESPLKEEYLLAAVDSLLDGDEIERASLVMDGLSASDLPEPLQQHYTVNMARLALAGQQPDAVLELLQDPPNEGPFAGKYRALRGTARLMKKEYAAAAQEFIERNTYLTDPDQQLDNQFSTWEAVSGLSDPELQQLRTAPPPDAFSGWLELVELTRLYLQQPDALGDVIPHWQMRYPGHPASEQFMMELLGGMRALGQPPEQVALLLPLSGKLAGAATAIRDGLLAAYYDTPEDSSRSVIRIYDTGADPLAAGDVYQQAVADGARFVIGPLRKQSVTTLMQLEQLPVPLLALNQVETTEPVNTAIYQFGLAPEDEAREVAQRAMRDGHLQAIALVPEGDWGERVYAAFAEEWFKLGGFLLEHSTYNPAETDHGKIISAALNLDDSNARKTRLTRLLGQQLEFEPRRRQDVDFIFLLATPKQARLIRPQLSFYRASRVPVYSTSHVYSGYPDKARDTDINGMLFCDLPWILESGGSWQHLQKTVNERWPDNARQYNRFYALGIDSWRITPYLNQLEGGIFGAYQGVTGKLSLDPQQQVHRTLRWAQFKSGLPYLLDAVPEPGTGTATATD